MKEVKFFPEQAHSHERAEIIIIIIIIIKRKEQEHSHERAEINKHGYCRSYDYCNCGRVEFG